LKLDNSYEERLEKWKAGEYRKQMVDFTQRLLGYMLLGTNPEQKFVIFVGDKGRNGKGVLTHTLLKIFGNYVTSTRSETFMKARQHNSSSATPELVKLDGVRIVIGDENDRGDQLNATLLKRCTGGDLISGRQLYKSEITFKPKFIPLLLTNYFPYMDTEDMALFSRIICIPFDKTYKENPDADNPFEGQIDTDLERKLEAEYPAILKWIVEGAKKYLADGKLNIPEFIQLAGKEYKNSKDILGSFIDECCTIDEVEKISSRDLYSAYAQWCYESNIQHMRIQTFVERMGSRGFANKKNSKGYKEYKGIITNSLGAEMLEAYNKRKHPTY